MTEPRWDFEVESGRITHAEETIRVGDTYPYVYPDYGPPAGWYGETHFVLPAEWGNIGYAFMLFRVNGPLDYQLVDVVEHPHPSPLPFFRAMFQTSNPNVLCLPAPTWSDSMHPPYLLRREGDSLTVEEPFGPSMLNLQDSFPLVTDDVPGDGDSGSWNYDGNRGFPEVFELAPNRYLLCTSHVQQNTSGTPTQYRWWPVVVVFEVNPDNGTWQHGDPHRFQFTESPYHHGSFSDWNGNLLVMGAMPSSQGVVLAWANNATPSAEFGGDNPTTDEITVDGSWSAINGVWGPWMWVSRLTIGNLEVMSHQMTRSHLRQSAISAIPNLEQDPGPRYYTSEFDRIPPGLWEGPNGLITHLNMYWYLASPVAVPGQASGEDYIEGIVAYRIDPSMWNAEIAHSIDYLERISEVSSSDNASPNNRWNDGVYWSTQVHARPNAVVVTHTHTWTDTPEYNFREYKYTNQGVDLIHNRYLVVPGYIVGQDYRWSYYEHASLSPKGEHGFIVFMGDLSNDAPEVWPFHRTLKVPHLRLIQRDDKAKRINEETYSTSLQSGNIRVAGKNRYV